MFEEIASENDIKALWIQWPLDGTVMKKELDVGVEPKTGVRVHVHCVFRPRIYVINKLSIATP